MKVYKIRLKSDKNKFISGEMIPYLSVIGKTWHSWQDIESHVRVRVERIYHSWVDKDQIKNYLESFFKKYEIVEYEISEIKTIDSIKDYESKFK